VAGSCEYGDEPLGSINVGKFLSSCATPSFSRRAQLHGVRQSGRLTLRYLRMILLIDLRLRREAQTVTHLGTIVILIVIFGTGTFTSYSIFISIN
jgi:hypothetical protein